MPYSPGWRPRGFFLCAVALAFLAACEQPETARSTTYFDESLGWTFSIPPGWHERPNVERDAVRSEGKTLIEETLDVEIRGLPRPVLYLKFDRHNRFTSDAESYDPARDGPYDQTTRSEFELLRRTLAKVLGDEGLALRHWDEQMQIDGVPFAVMTMEVLREGGQDVLVTSVVFDGLIGDQSFAISYTCRSQPRCEEIRDAILNSRFSTQKPASSRSLVG